VFAKTVFSVGASKKPLVNMVQLAQHTGLSIAAVSSVLNGRWKERRIAEDTVKRVQNAAKELGYVPNIFARQLSAHAPGTSQALLAIITAYEAPLTLVSAAASALHRKVEQQRRSSTRFTIAIEMFEAGKLKQLNGVLSNHRFSGAIIANTVEADDRFLAREEIPYPVVLINRSVGQLPSVIESPETGAAAARVLLEAGCRACAVLSPVVSTRATSGRAEDFVNTVKSLTGGSAPILTCAGRDEADGYAAMHAQLRRKREIDGLFAVNDTLAIGAYRAIQEAGLRVPEDIRVVGVGDHSASPYLNPPLTCVGSSEERLHEEAAELLLAQFLGERERALHRVLPLQIIRRGSTGGE